MSRNWTPAQLSAMNTRGRTLLISAAAGSGKTATLTERIIRRITDPEHPADLSRMLIVTFTKAAAAELKQRISKALSDAIAADPGNRHLQDQIIRMGSAHISTIDAFCYQPVKEHFAESGMPASFRIADDAELIPLREKIMNDLIDEFYEKYASSSNTSFEDEAIFSLLKNNPFADLCDSLSTFKNDESLFVTLNKLYNDLLNFPEGIQRLHMEAERLSQSCEQDFFGSDHGKLLYEWTEIFCSSALVFYESALHSVADDPAAFKAYGESLSHEYDFFKLLKLSLNNGSYESVRQVIHSFVATAFKSCRNPAKDHTQLKKRRKKYLDEIAKLRTDYYNASAEFLKQNSRHLAEVCHVLYDLLDTYDQRLTEAKKQRGICDFTDNRRRLLSMLLSPDGSPSPLCHSYLEAYDEVYIDEYQDVDEVQDTIFRLIGGNHRFMVGDIKQSIYGFRGAEPSVFAGYRQRLPALSEGASNAGNSIFMSDNFRCDEAVIRVTNGICSHIFSTCPKSVGYRPEDDLGFSKPCPEGYVAPKVRISMLTAAGKNDEKGAFSGNDAEAVYVANQIASLLRSKTLLADGSPIRPKDIAILMRDNAQMATFRAALVSMGIPTGCDELESVNAAKDLLHGPDMICLWNLLRVINNPDNDVALSELLRNEFPGLSLDQLITLRQSADTGASLYGALESYLSVEQPDMGLYERVKAFTAWLEGYRALSHTLTAEGLLRLLRGDERVSCRNSAAFRYLYESARTCRVSPFTGLYTFLKYFESKVLTEKRVTVESAAESTDGVVSLMTIHHSKGLEFPVCFVVRCGHTMKNKSASDDLVFEKNAGVAVKFYDREAQKKYDNALRRISSLAKYHREKEEEMRILYVAMTRARERLYLIGFSSETRAPFPAEDRYEALTAGSYMEWIKAGLNAHPEILPFCEIHELCENTIERDAYLSKEYHAETSESQDDVAAYYQRLQGLCVQLSPLEEMLRSVPSKVPASRMTDKLLDECVFYNSDLPVGDEDKLPMSERGAAAFDTQSYDHIARSLSLMSKSDSPDEFELLLKANTRPTAAEKGTAAHMFLQYCHWQGVYKNGIEEEIAHLLEEGFITQRVADILDRKQLSAFFESEFARGAYSATRMERELKFQRFIPLCELTSHADLAEALGDRTLYVRGSIDLLCEYSDGRLEICDYKTDHITREERENRDILLAHLREKHLSQLKQYAAAMEEMFGKRPDKVYIFALALGEAVEIDINA
ncbi:MAG: UvrD-helicase domain-containing protein [Clostridia bacterium]|nr:UvrD-helicase domain-containing protein [Clostridia bacterium]